ncbi:MAG: hypothetical protein LBH05_07210 [Deferribacteraceae bacterium]|jgi:hypothetical protein|nr:hypothetical protein [Deferribacteraceae bacterium]
MSFPLYPVYAQNKVSAGYEYIISRENNYSDSYFSYNFSARGSNVILSYNRTDGRNAEYDPLQKVMLAYYYMGDNHMFGAIAMSASDKPFNTFETTSMIGFYGYSIFSKVIGKESVPLPNGEMYEYDRKTALYVGVGASREPIVFGGYFLPVFSYVYQGKHLYLTLGLPMTSIAFIPSQMHRFMYVINFTGTGDLKYEFRPTPTDNFAFEYVEAQNAYRLSDVVVHSENKDSRLIYQESWFRVKYNRMFSNDFGITAGFAMMTNGYRFSGKYYHESPSGRLAPVIKYIVSTEIKF